MARYNTYGQLDSPHAVDTDMSFLRMVTRINPEELPPGEVALSENGRMDANRTWRVRNGADRYVDSPDLWLNGASGTTATAITAYRDEDTGIDWIFSATSEGVMASKTAKETTTAGRVFMYLPATPDVAPGGLVTDRNSVYLFNGATSVPMKFSGGIENVGITTAVRASNIITATTAAVHGYSVGDKVSVFNMVDFADGIPNKYATILATPTTTTFTYLDIGVDEGPHAQTSTTCGVCKTFELVSTTASTATSDDDVSMVVVDGLGTVSVTAHGRSDKDVLTVYAGGASGLVDGDKYAINYIDADSYSIAAEIPDGTYTITLGGKQPISGGYVAMPKAKWGVVHENRLVLPYDPTGNAGDTDEIIYSDVFDFETFDPIVNQLRFKTSASDYVVNYIPITADRAIVLCSRSVHLVVGITGSLLDIERYEITREFGCISPRSAVYANGSIIFLSRNGVVSISIQNNYELFVNPVPLSQAIQEDLEPYLSTSFDQAERSHAAFFNNRYYLFITNDSGYPDELFVYNFLNEGWESKDDYPVTYTDTTPSDKVGVAPNHGLFVQGSAGNVFMLDADGVVADDTESSLVAIAGKLVTRGYQFGNLNTKRDRKSVV